MAVQPFLECAVLKGILYISLYTLYIVVKYIQIKTRSYKHFAQIMQSWTR